MLLKMKKASKIILIFIFLILLISDVLIAYNIFFQSVYYDSSPELVLADLLANENSVITDSWYYSTEIRVLYTQIVNSILFKIFSDWRIVNTLSLLIHLLILEVALYYFIHKVLKEKNTKCYWIAAIWVLVPYSWIWRLYVLDGMFYIPHFIIMLLAAGGMLSAIQCINKMQDQKQENRKVIVGLCIFQILLAFLAGMGGIRHLEITYLPIFAASLLLAFYDKNRKKEKYIAVKLAMLLLISSGCGYIVNSKILVNLFDFSSYNDIKLVGFSFSRLENIFGCIHQNFAYVSGIELFTFSGIASICSFIIWLIVIVMIVVVIKNFKKICFEEQFLYLFTAMNWLLNIFVLLFTDNAIEARYFLPQVFLLVICIAVFVRRSYLEKGLYLRIETMRGISILLVAFLLLESVNGYRDWINEDKNSPELRETVSYLVKNNYAMGYSDFYTGGAIPALSNGEIDMCWVKDFNSFEPNPWLVKKDLVERKSGKEKTFLLLTNDQYNEVSDEYYISQGSFIRVNNDYVLIVYPSLSDLWKYLR